MTFQIKLTPAQTSVIRRAWNKCGVHGGAMFAQVATKGSLPRVAKNVLRVGVFDAQEAPKIQRTLDQIYVAQASAKTDSASKEKTA